MAFFLPLMEHFTEEGQRQIEGHSICMPCKDIYPLAEQHYVPMQHFSHHQQASITPKLHPSVTMQTQGGAE